MFIRLATETDIPYITHALAPKRIDYIKPSQARADIKAQRLYVIDLNGKPIAQCSLVEEAEFGYVALKRMTIYNQATKVKGIADMFITHFSSLNLPIGATPWTENERMKHILLKNGFKYQYTFAEKYEFFLKTP